MKDYSHACVAGRWRLLPAFTQLQSAGCVGDSSPGAADFHGVCLAHFDDVFSCRQAQRAGARVQVILEKRGSAGRVADDEPCLFQGLDFDGVGVSRERASVAFIVGWIGFLNRGEADEGRRRLRCAVGLCEQCGVV